MIYSQLSVVWLPQVSKLVTSTSFCTIRLMTESYQSPVSSLSHWQVSTCSSSQPWHPWRMAPPSYPAKLPRHPVPCQTPKWPQDGGQVPLFLVPQSPISTATQVPNPGPLIGPGMTWSPGIANGQISKEHTAGPWQLSPLLQQPCGSKVHHLRGQNSKHI